MAASAWQLYSKAKRYLGNGTIQLGVNNFKMALFRAASNTSTFTLSTFGSLTNEISATGGYVSGGKALVPATGTWALTSANSTVVKFTYSTVGLTFTASGAPLTNVKYAVIFQSAATLANGKLLCFCQLSSSQFTVSSPNTLTVLPAATGVFTLT